MKPFMRRSEEHTSELQSRQYLVCRLLLEKKKNTPLPLKLSTSRRTRASSTVFSRASSAPRLRLELPRSPPDVAVVFCFFFFFFLSGPPPSSSPPPPPPPPPRP